MGGCHRFFIHSLRVSLSLSFSLFLFLLQEVEWEASFHKNSQLPQEKLPILGFLAAVHSCHEDSHHAGSPAEFTKNPCSENGSKEVRGEGSQYICDLMKGCMYSSIYLGRNLLLFARNRYLS